VTLTTELPGRTTPFAVAEIRPQVSGIIQKRFFVEGREIRAGQLLYQIDPAPYQATYDNARAAFLASQAKAGRYSELIKEKAISRQDYDDAIAVYRQAEANVRSARINLNYTHVTAPISGRTGVSTVTPGALVTADQTLVLTTVQTLDPIYVDIPQSSAQLLLLRRAAEKGEIDNKVSATAEVALVLEDGTNYARSGKLQLTDITVDPNTGSVMLRALFPNPHSVLLPGMFVRAIVNDGVVPDAILAPQQGVMRDTRGKPIAFVVGKDNKAELRQLVVSRAIGGNWLVTAGLRDGDRLIIEGIQNVRSGTEVRPVPVQAAVLGKPK
jgi:membrane fusion protein (multidrug efflux system)